MVRAALVIACALALAACASLWPRAATPAARGHALARRVCAACHAVEPGGDSPRPRAPGFASLEMRHTVGLEGRLAELTRLGHYGMPPQHLAPAEAADLAAYIESLTPR